jgi:thiol-disulfide isomerase/thioredoxin
MKELDELDRPVVIKFWATWCGPCKKFAPHFDAAAKNSDREFVSVDIDQSPELVEAFGIQSVPTVIELTEDSTRRLESRTAVALLRELEG